MTFEELNNIVDEIITHHTEYKTTPRELLGAFNASRRTSGNVSRIDEFLRKHSIRTTPNYSLGWVDKEIILKEVQNKETEGNNPLATERYMPTWNELKMKGLVVVKMGIPVVQSNVVQLIIDYLSQIDIIQDENGISINTDELGISEPAYAQLCSDLDLLPWKKHEMPTLDPRVSAYINGIVNKTSHAEKNKNVRQQTEIRLGADEQSISNFYIHNYKNIDRLELKDLKQVNLLIGANNAGKSNVLEAISLYATNFSPYRMKDILRDRNENLDYFDNAHAFRENELIEAFAPFFPHRDIDFLANDNYIQLGTEKGAIRLIQRITRYREEEGITRLVKLIPYKKITANQRLSMERQEVLVSLPVKGLEEQKTKTSRFKDVLHMTKFTNKGIEILPTGTTNRFKFQHINCKRLTTDKIEDIWAKIAMTDVEEKIIEALQIIDERIEKFSFIKNDSRKYAPYVHLKGENANMPISEMGDGMTHILNMIIALLGCENGILLLDEAESGLHYTTQNKLWKLIFELSEKYHVQVFATTHSNDCINAFRKNNLVQRGLIYRLEHVKQHFRSQRYDNERQLEFLMGNNIDIR